MGTYVTAEVIRDNVSPQRAKFRPSLLFWRV